MNKRNKKQASEKEPNKIISLLPNFDVTHIAKSEPIIPVALMIIGKILSNWGKTPSIKSPEYCITEGPPKKGCWADKKTAANKAILLLAQLCDPSYSYWFTFNSDYFNENLLENF